MLQRFSPKNTAKERRGITYGQVVLSGGLTIIAVMIMIKGTVYLKGNKGFPAQAPSIVQAADNNIEFRVELEPQKTTSEDAFVNYRLKREQSRQEAKSMLWELLDSDIDSIRVNAQTKWLDLTNKIAQENELENLLKINGFQDAVAGVNLDGISIFIFQSNLALDESRMIRKLVSRITKVRADRINISFKSQTDKT